MVPNPPVSAVLLSMVRLLRNSGFIYEPAELPCRASARG